MEGGCHCSAGSAGHEICERVMDYVAMTPAFTVAISKVCLLKRPRSLQPKKPPQNTQPAASYDDATAAKSAGVDASLQSLMQAACQPIKAEQSSQLQSQQALEAADMLAWNVLMAPHLSSALPASAKQQLQDAAVFRACCYALLCFSGSETSPQAESSSLRDNAGNPDSKAVNVRRGASLTWARCAWAVANLAQIAAGEPVHRKLVNAACWSTSKIQGPAFLLLFACSASQAAYALAAVHSLCVLLIQGLLPA